MTSLAAHDDEWELCNEDGFVYKRRRKRPRQAAAPPPPPAGPSEEDMREWRLQRRRRALLKLREESRTEIRQWEGFAGELQQMNLSQRQSPSPASPLLRIADFPMSGAVDEVVIDRLLSQAEAQRELIDGISRLSDTAVAKCDEWKRQISQPLFDLPVWGSPRSLLAALTDDENDVGQIVGNEKGTFMIQAD